MKKILVLFLFVGIALVAIITCPQKDAHKDALMKLVNVDLDTELYDKAKTEEEMGFAMLGSVIGSGIAEIILDKKLLVDNYFNCFSRYFSVLSVHPHLQEKSHVHRFS